MTLTNPSPFEHIPQAPVVLPPPELHTILWTAGFALCAALAALLTKGITRTWLNPVTVYLGVWTAVVLLIAGGLVDALRLTDETWGLLSAASACFVGGALFVWLFTRDRSGISEPDRPRYDQRRLKKWYRWGLVALALYTALQVSKLLPLIGRVGGISGVLAGGGAAFREAQSESSALTAETEFTNGGVVVGLAGYVLLLGMLTVFWAGYRARAGEWWAALAPLLLLALYSFAALQRATFIYGVVMFAFSYHYHRDWFPKKARPPIALILLVILGLLVVLIPIALRKPPNPGQPGVASPIDYFTDGLAGLNTLLIDHVTGPPPQPGYGVWTLFGPASLLHRFGVNVPLPRASTLFYVSVGAGRYDPSNVYSWIIYPLYDFGTGGVMCFAALFGGVAAYFHRAVTLGRRLDFIPVLCILSASVAMSFFGLSLLRDARFLVLAAASLVIRRWIIVSPGRKMVAARRPWRKSPVGATGYGP